MVIKLQPWGPNNWFHSRSSSSKGEFKTIKRFAELSKEQTPGASITSIESKVKQTSSAIGTKVRAFIRFGFLKDSLRCPLQFTTLGKLWYDLDQKKLEGNPEEKIKRLILFTNLSFYSFDGSGYQIVPKDHFIPFQELIKKYPVGSKVTKRELLKLIGEANFTYWLVDLINSGFLEKISKTKYLVLSQFQGLIETIKKTNLPDLSEDEWRTIHNNLLDKNNPYREALLEELDKIINEIKVEPESVKEDLEKIIDETSEVFIEDIEKGDYKVKDAFSKTKVRRKQSAWSQIVKTNFAYRCCMPNCDIAQKDLVAAAHIKPYSEKEVGTGHRADPSNGLCFCPLCHKLFDKGYFTISDDMKIILSPEIKGIKSKVIQNLIAKSGKMTISPTPAKIKIKKEYLNFHRKNIFKQ